MTDTERAAVALIRAEDRRTRAQLDGRRYWQENVSIATRMHADAHRAFDAAVRAHIAATERTEATT